MYRATQALVWLVPLKDSSVQCRQALLWGEKTTISLYYIKFTVLILYRWPTWMHQAQERYSTTQYFLFFPRQAVAGVKSYDNSGILHPLNL